MDAKIIVYNKKKSPFANIQGIFEQLKTLNYEHKYIMIDDVKNYYLEGAWPSIDDLKGYLIDFEVNFVKQLIDFGMSDKFKKDYVSYLQVCQLELYRINRYFSYYDPSITVKAIDEKTGEMGTITDLSTLSQKMFIEMREAYALIGHFFRNLEFCVRDEKEEMERQKYVRANNSYKWTGQKNDLSELARAIYNTGVIKKEGGGKALPGSFARELAAFFGIDKLNFEQDNELRGSRQKRKAGEFIDKCKAALLKFNEEKYDKK